MDFHELIRVRRSVRGYTSEAPADDQIARVLSAAVIAPTAANLQPWTFIVVTDAETRAKFKTVYSKDWFWQAPVIVIACVDPGKAWHRADGYCSAELDVAIALDHLVLAATAEGLGSCWVCAFDEAKAKEMLGIPQEIRVIAMTPLGFPAEVSERRSAVRKRASDLIKRDRW